MLWWDADLQARAWRQTAAAIRGAPFTDEELDLHVHDRNNQHALEYLAGRSLGAGELGRLSWEKESLYRRLCLEQGERLRLSPEAVGLLDHLAAQGIPRTIATAYEKANLDFFVEHLGLEKWFDLDRIVYDDGSLAGKPAPVMHLESAGMLGLQPDSCVVVKDSVSGLAAARAAGIGCVVALGPEAQHERLHLVPGVDRVVAHLGQFPREELF